jgi:ornithine--oxo-acid transaminase
MTHTAASLPHQAVRLIGIAGAPGVPATHAAGSERAAAALARADVGAGVRHNGWSCRFDLLELPATAANLAAGERLRRLCKETAAAVAASLSAGELPVVLSGDHALAVGTWRGVATALGKLPGLLWIDAHLDAHTSDDSPTGNAHGMPLAALLGEAPNPWHDSSAQVDPARVCLFGVRSFEPAERQRLDRLGVRIVGIGEIKARGLRPCLAEALTHVAADGPFGLSLDLDAIDPLAAPGVNTPAPGGLDGNELIDALRGLAAQEALVAIEIAEFNADEDRDGRTARLVARLLESLTAPDADGCQALEHRHGAHNYAPLPVVLTRGEGVRVWDTAGRCYLDLMAAYSAASFGHAHPQLVAALTQQAARLAVPSRAYFNDRLPLLLARLSSLFGYHAALPVNTGLEAVETALKAARKWGYRHKGVPADRAEIIACDGNFHGRSIAIVALSSEAQYRDGFGPFPPGMHRVAYGDPAALEAAITPNTVAFLVEPIQGEAGIVVPPAGYLRACAEICRRHEVLLLCDEVQTGLGRSGALLASWHEGVRPDGVILGKALGGGLLPVSAFLADRWLMDVFTPGDHGSTFGGNPLAASVALAALDLLVEEDLPARAAALGSHLLERLRAIDNPVVKEVRGQGLFAGIEIDPRFGNAWTACLYLLDAGVLSKDTHGTTLRIAPPLTISRAELDEGIDRVEAGLRQFARKRPAAEAPPVQANNAQTAARIFLRT